MLEQLKKLLGNKEYNARDTIKFIYKSDKPLKQNRRGTYALFPGVPCEVLKRLSIHEYELLIKAASLKAYIHKQEGN